MSDDIAKKNAELETENAVLKAENAALKTENDQLLKVVATGNTDNLKAQTVELPEIKHEKKTYRFLVPKFRLAGDPELYFSAAAASDTAIIKKILAINGQKILAEA